LDHRVRASASVLTAEFERSRRSFLQIRYTPEPPA
jgi:hypothetical protein